MSISGVGNVTLNGSTTVSPTTTTTYTLTATSADGKSVTAPVTVIVHRRAGPADRDVRGEPADHRRRQLHQAVLAGDGATNITITPGVGSNLNANDCATVSPTQTTTYTLTATNAQRPDPGQRDGERRRRCASCRSRPIR